ncbi:histidine kinase [Labilibaculum sp.]|uniref:sensor histidine kinase n=1 Tax=Labilibaculum sp. TaxID=2060723 RepID=UPI002AA6D129|nr:histidine kinase [Labilibaculum sp.]MBN2596886.1 histidine kinase [Marinifilaceae bacterium]
MSEGLPSNIILDIFEDSRGLVWLATDVGLFEFIGEEIKFRKELSRLQGERINSICEDKKGNLWFAAQGVGLCKFDGKRLSVFPLDSVSEESDIACLAKNAASDNLIVGSSDGVFVYKEQNSKLKRVGNLWNKSVFKIRQFQNKFVVNSVSQKENVEFEIESGKVLEYHIEANLPVVQIGYQNSNTELRNLLESGKPFTLITKTKKKLVCDVVEVEGNETQKFYLLRYFEKEIEKQKLIRLRGDLLSDLSDKKMLDECVIHSIFLRKGYDDLWIGTHNQGLIQLQNSKFTYLDSDLLGFKNTLLKDLVCDRRGNIIVASKNEISIFQASQVQHRLIVNDFCSLSDREFKCLKDFSIYKLGTDKDELVWISTSRGFFTLNVDNFQLKYIGITPAKNFVFTEDDELLCFWQNQFKFYTKSGLDSQKPILKFPKSARIGVSKMVAKNSSIWISTRQKGIVQFKNNEFRIFNRKNSNIHNVLNDILVLPDSTIIASGNNGLIYKIKSKSSGLVLIDSITGLNGLVGTSIHGIQYLQDGSLWCGTNLGVHRFEYSSWLKNSELKFKFWNSKDGYFDQSGEQSVIDKDQNIWVKTKNRLLKIETNTGNRKHFESKISIKSIRIHDEDWRPAGSQADVWTNSPISPIELKYDENDLAFAFGLDFCQNISNVRFRYLLDGFDERWSNWSNSSEAVFSHLPSGNYTLKVEAKHLSEGVIIPFSFDIVVKTPWYRMWWFIILSGLVLGGIVYVAMWCYAYFIRKREKARTKQFNRVIGLKMKSLQNQLDPHFIFNSLNSIQSYILGEKKESALEYLSDFSDVLRKKIENANKDFISLSDEIAYLQLYLKLEQMRFSNKFSYKITVNTAINPYQSKLPPMLIQPFLENAIRYGLAGAETKGDLDVNFEIEHDGYLRCIIKDNGVGRKKTKSLHEDSNIKIHHKTMIITKDRIKLLNKVLSNGRVYEYFIEDLMDENGFPSGTKVEIGFPKQ